jgi:hypothetical protein
MKNSRSYHTRFKNPRLLPERADGEKEEYGQMLTRVND